MYFYLSLILFAIALLLANDNKLAKVLVFFKFNKQTSDKVELININSLDDNKKAQAFAKALLHIQETLANTSTIYICIFTLVSLWFSWFVSYQLLASGSLLLSLGLFAVLLVVGYKAITNFKRKQFEHQFPDVLNVLMSAISAGDSLMQGITYVGDTIDNEVGQEFKHMAQRLKIGEAPEDVLKRACKKYPYPEFIFFSTTLRANIKKGGQLKGVMARLIRVLVDARTIRQKKWR